MRNFTIEELEIMDTEVDAEVERLASAITGWDTQNIRDLKSAIEELKEYGQSEEYYYSVGDPDIMSYADIDISALPSAPIPDDIDTTGIWAVDVNGMCLAGDGFPGNVMTLAEAVQIYNHHTH